MKVISGGQTGADRGAILAAYSLGLPYCGWVPKGRHSEDGQVPAWLDQLQEHPSADYAHRTWRNVHDADVTVIICRQPPQQGSALTVRLAREMGKPFVILDAHKLLREPQAVFDQVMVFLWECNRTETVNVAGSRESSVPGLQGAVQWLFQRILFSIAAGW